MNKIEEKEILYTRYKHHSDNKYEIVIHSHVDFNQNMVLNKAEAASLIEILTDFINWTSIGTYGKSGEVPILDINQMKSIDQKYHYKGKYPKPK